MAKYLVLSGMNTLYWCFQTASHCACTSSSAGLTARAMPNAKEARASLCGLTMWIMKYAIVLTHTAPCPYWCFKPGQVASADGV